MKDPMSVIELLLHHVLTHMYRNVQVAYTQQYGCRHSNVIGIEVFLAQIRGIRTTDSL